MKKILICLLIAVVLLSGCNSSMEVEETKYNEITGQEAKEIMDTEDVIILDVRTPEEYQEEHIEDAILIPDYDLESLAESKLPDKDKKILVYCRSGNRSEAATKELIDMGYKNVYDFGGINSWSYETIKGK